MESYVTFKLQKNVLYFLLNKRKISLKNVSKRFLTFSDVPWDIVSFNII